MNLREIKAQNLVISKKTPILGLESLILFDYYTFSATNVGSSVSCTRSTSPPRAASFSWNL